MRISLVLAPMVLVAAPVSAQPAAQEIAEAQRVIADPKLTNTLVDMVQSLSGLMLSMPVGDIEAATQGRKPTAADHRRTVASESGLTDAQLRSRIEAARPLLVNGMAAMAKALPAMANSMARMEQVLDRADANMPDPNYPRR